MPKVPHVRPKQLSKTLERLGFIRVRQKGSHAIYRHPDGRMTIVPMHPGTIPPGTLRGILTDIHISIDELRDAL